MIGRKTLLLTLTLPAVLALFGSGYNAWAHATIQQPRRQRALAQAISQQDSATVAKLLREGTDVNCGVDPPAPDLEPLGYTPLSIAVLRQDPNIVRLLLDHGANPNKRLAQLTPLMLAVGKGDRKSARYLLAAGSKPNARSCYNNSAMAIARGRKDRPMIRLLQSFGARE